MPTRCSCAKSHFLQAVKPIHCLKVCHLKQRMAPHPLFGPYLGSNLAANWNVFRYETCRIAEQNQGGEHIFQGLTSEL